jgi:hypothetical protein
LFEIVMILKKIKIIYKNIQDQENDGR